ncbi:M1 family metallopeptidase [Roseivirga sp.]|uniref:M1 family metallopeptidase n=1 Tax=Roseivirga sp. TaxID=1964215 RepID=UPI003B8AB5F3
MRLRLSILAILLSTSLMAQKHHERLEKIDVQHYQFALKLNDQNDRIEGVAKIDIKFNKDISDFYLDLINESEGKGMNVDGISIDGQKTSFTHQNDRLTLDYKGKKGDVKKLIISYQGIPKTGLVIAENKHGDRTFFGDNWPDRGRHWLPTVDHPSDKATVEWIVTAPNYYQVIGNGRFVERTNLTDDLTLTHWRSDVVIPTKVMVMGAARFAVEEVGEVHGAPISTWVYPQDRENGFYDYSQAYSIIDWFINNIGPYPYAKLANVQSKTQFGGMENASNIFYFENSVTGERAFEGLIAHEIAHQWFGNSASEADWHHVWLSEGFATYFTNVYMEKTHGRDRFVEMVKEQRDQIITFSKGQMVPVVNTAITDYMKLLNTNSYQKGGWVLHMLRRKVGDDLFWKGIRAYYKKYTLSNAYTEDLQQVFETVTGTDLDAFFKQWIYTAGQPNIFVDHSYKKGVLNLLVVQEQSEVFDFPLEMDIVLKDGTIQRHVIQVNEKRQAFTLDLKEKPATIVLDPDSWLLFEGKVSGN